MRRNPNIFYRPATALVAPVIADLPVLLGTPTNGVPVPFNRSAVSGSTPIVSTQQWSVNGIDISGATGNTYTPVTGDTIAVRQIETNSTGVDTATSASAVVTAVMGAYQIATYGDSRADLGSVSNGPDLFDGSMRDMVGLLNAPTFVGALSVFMKDSVLTVNGGRSGETTNGWASTTRAGGVTLTAVKALSWDVIIIQYGVNDVSQGVTSTATRDSIAANACNNIQALITSLLATGRKVIWQTTYQRTASDYGVNAVLMRDSVDIINYGNGSTIQGMTAWVSAQSSFNTLLYIHDVQSLINLAGAATGAYLDSAWSADGTHPDYTGSRRIAKSMAAKLRTIYTDRGYPAMHRAVGPNLIPAATAAYYGGQMLQNCTVVSNTYGTDASSNGYGETTVTPNGTAGYFKFEMVADVGTNGGRTPVGGAFAVNDILRSRVLLTLDNGSGGTCAVTNVLLNLYCSYIGGTPGLQRVGYSGSGQGTANHAEADTAALYTTQPLKMTGGSSLIGAPLGGSGLRIYVQIYFSATTTPFRVRWTAPELRKVV